MTTQPILIWLADACVFPYAYVLWDVFITELKQLATPGLSSVAAWKTAKRADKLKVKKKSEVQYILMSQW